MNEGWVALLCKDGPKRPGNGNRSWKISFGSGESIGRSRCLEEETRVELIEVDSNVRNKGDIQGKEHKYFGPDTSMMMEFVNAESLKGCEDNKNGRPPVIEGEWEMDEKLVRHGFCNVVLLDDIVDMLKISIEQ